MVMKSESCLLLCLLVLLLPPGWEFNGAGACTRIPQIGDERAHATACASQRSCVASYQVQVRPAAHSSMQGLTRVMSYAHHNAEHDDLPALYHASSFA